MLTVVKSVVPRKAHFQLQDDASRSTNDDFLSWFELSPESFPWREPIPRNVEVRRALMSDVLIFDILLSSGGIRNPESVYPPTDVDSVRSLLEQIETSTYDRLKKDCLVYFLLKWYQDGEKIGFRRRDVYHLSSQRLRVLIGIWTLGSTYLYVLCSRSRHMSGFPTASLS